MLEIHDVGIGPHVCLSCVIFLFKADVPASSTSSTKASPVAQPPVKKPPAPAVKTPKAVTKFMLPKRPKPAPLFPAK